MSERRCSTSWRPCDLGVVDVDDDAEGVDGDRVDEDVELDELLGAVVGEGVVEAGVALGARLQLVVEVDEHLGEGHLVLEEDAAVALLGGVLQVLHLVEGAAAAGDELHDRADVAVGGDDRDGHPGLADLVDRAGVGHVGRGVDLDLAAVGGADVVLDAGRGGQEVEVVLAFEALLDDVHVEQAEEAAAEAGAERDGVLRLVVERRRR